MKTVIQFLCGMNDGGAETLVKDYCVLSKMDNFNIFPVVIYPSLPNCANERILNENSIPIESIYDRYSLRNRINNKLFPMATAMKFKNILQKYKPDAIHAHMLCLRYLVYISDYIKENNIKLFYTCHNNPDFMMNEGGIEYKACKYLIKYNHLQMIALHKNMADKMNEMYDVSNTVIINNGIDFSRYENISKTKGEIRREIGIPEDCFLIGHVGRFSEEKNHKFILSVFKQCVFKNDKSYLLLVGNGPLESKIKQLVKDMGLENRVYFLSHRTDVPLLLKSMDCFIFPSIYEGLGMAAIEAQLAGLKVIISDSVPKEVRLTRNVIVRSLNDTVELWAQSVLYDTGNCEIVSKIEKYDMRQIINGLEVLYSN
jgi:glycosyltransferase involved in cell wall biosynthesis